MGISGGMNNAAPGTLATVVGGMGNVASGKNSVAMGFDAEARDNYSVVVNLADGGAKSKKSRQFLVNSELFTISISNQMASITEDNIGRLCDELNTCGRRRLESDNDDGTIIRNLQD